MAGAIVSALLLIALTSCGLLQRCSDIAGNLSLPGSYIHGLLLFGLVGSIGFCVDQASALVRTFSIENRFGFNRTTPQLYCIDLLKQIGLSVAIGVPMVFSVLWLMDHMGTTWWLWVWLYWLGFNCLVLVVYPTLIAPLFNKFTPLADQAMKLRIEDFLCRCGFKSGGLFVMDGSRRSAHGNAYFSGLGTAKRIVLFDTLLEKLQPDEINAVLAHELGHFRHHHLWKRLVLLSALSMALLWLLGWLRMEPGFFSTFGTSDNSTAMALILFSLVLPVILFPLTPLLSFVSRQQEYEADAYAVQQTGGKSLIRALVKLYRDNASTLTPDPLYSLFHDSHPPASLRIKRLEEIPA